jgi:hypothetical protein
MDKIQSPSNFEAVEAKEINLAEQWHYLYAPSLDYIRSIGTRIPETAVIKCLKSVAVYMTKEQIGGIKLAEEKGKNI